ncbi:MAG TPA: long-chain-acyl-CoA synthetase [Verrucomicrobiae bacterium]|nr:long-chain-acyl-CoA synthetase [Verrucomicrobiae bacterium]
MKALEATAIPSAAQMWLGALERTAPIRDNPHRTFPDVIEELAEKFGTAPALLADGECLTHRQLAERSNQYARWALAVGLRKGEVVGLLMANCAEYMAIWLGITRIGGVVALLNTKLSGPSLAHCIRSADPKLIIVDAGSHDGLGRAVPEFVSHERIRVGGAQMVRRYSGECLREAERGAVSIEDTALYIYTSGTTGLPKAARVSHGRVMQWTHWFAGIIDAGPEDRMYNCLPMYHSVGGVVAMGAALVGGGSVVVKEGFSARQFWDDIVRWDCTLFQYIGELCRYLLAREPAAGERDHRIRMICGNGLRLDVWNDFKERFQIPRILEFYAATEGSFSLYNAEGKPGAIGRIPPFLAHRFPVALVRHDAQREQPLRDQSGLCVRCAPNEPGEAIGRISDSGGAGGRFEGYTDAEASEAKVLRNVFKSGDAWFRTGDLMRRDEKGFFYFIDRLGDTFRWKGENVSTSEVSQAICGFPGVRLANCYGVRVPGAEGRAGMAAVVTEAGLNLAAFRLHLVNLLPGYACPLFLRIVDDLPVTGTFKLAKQDLVRAGYNPRETANRVFFNDPVKGAFVPLDEELYERLQRGQIRL